MLAGARVTVVRRRTRPASTVTVEHGRGRQTHPQHVPRGLRRRAQHRSRRVSAWRSRARPIPRQRLLATTTFPFEAHLEGLSNVTYCWREGAGNFSLLRVPGRWRVSIYPREDVPIEAQMTPEAIEASLQAIVPRDEAYEVLREPALSRAHAHGVTLLRSAASRSRGTRRMSTARPAGWA